MHTETIDDTTTRWKMSKYTAEQVEETERDLREWIIDGKGGIHHNELRGKHQDKTADMLHDYAALLREREAAKAGVTDELAGELLRKFEGTVNDGGIDYLCRRGRMRSALEAVAPMLASMKVITDGSPADGMTLVPIVDANNYCRILSLLGVEEEGDPVEWVRTMLASARVPDEMKSAPH